MNADTCVCCGAIIPEGRQVCWTCENGFSHTKQTGKLPSEAQIELADKIADTLGIDFPQCSAEFTAEIYWEFINKHYAEARAIWRDDGDCYDDLDGLAWFSPLNQ